MAITLKPQKTSRGEFYPLDDKLISDGSKPGKNVSKTKANNEFLSKIGTFGKNILKSTKNLTFDIVGQYAPNVKEVATSFKDAATLAKNDLKEEYAPIVDAAKKIKNWRPNGQIKQYISEEAANIKKRLKSGQFYTSEQENVESSYGDYEGIDDQYDVDAGYDGGGYNPQDSGSFTTVSEHDTLSEEPFGGVTKGDSRIINVTARNRERNARIASQNGARQTHKIKMKPSQGGVALGDQLVSETLNGSTGLIANKLDEIQAKQAYGQELLFERLYGYQNEILRGVNAIVEYNNNVQSQQVRSQMEFQAKSLAASEDMLSLLKEVKDSIIVSTTTLRMDGTRSNEEEQPNNLNRNITNGGAGFDAQGYAANLKENINDVIMQSPLGMLSVVAPAAGNILTAAGGGGLKGMINPLNLITRTLAGGLLSKATRGKMARFNERMKDFSGVFTGKMNELARFSDNKILSTIGRIFGTKTVTANTLDMGLKDPNAVVGWTSKSDRTLNEVIPTLLSKQLAAMTGKEETYYDYKSGMFKSVSTLKEEAKFKRERAYRNAKIDAFADKMTGLAAGQKDDFIEKGILDTNQAKSYKALSNSQIKKYIDKITENVVKSGMPFNPSLLDKPGKGETYKSELLTGIPKEHDYILKLYVDMFGRMNYNERADFAGATRQAGLNAQKEIDEINKDYATFGGGTALIESSTQDEIENIRRQLKSDVSLQYKGDPKKNITPWNQQVRKRRMELEKRVYELERSSNDNSSLQVKVDGFGSVGGNTESSSGTSGGVANNIFKLLSQGIVVYSVPTTPGVYPEHIKKLRKAFKVADDKVISAENAKNERTEEYLNQLVAENAAYYRGNLNLNYRRMAANDNIIDKIFGRVRNFQETNKVNRTVSNLVDAANNGYGMFLSGGASEGEGLFGPSGLFEEEFRASGGIVGSPKGGHIRHYATGGIIPGFGHEGDTINVKATPGEGILTKENFAVIKKKLGLPLETKNEDVLALMSAKTHGKTKEILSKLQSQGLDVSKYKLLSKNWFGLEDLRDKIGVAVDNFSMSKLGRTAQYAGGMALATGKEAGKAAIATGKVIGEKAVETGKILAKSGAIVAQMASLRRKKDDRAPLPYSVIEDMYADQLKIPEVSVAWNAFKAEEAIKAKGIEAGKKLAAFGVDVGDDILRGDIGGAIGKTIKGGIAGTGAAIGLAGKGIKALTTNVKGYGNTIEVKSKSQEIGKFAGTAAGALFSTIIMGNPILGGIIGNRLGKVLGGTIGNKYLNLRGALLQMGHIDAPSMKPEELYATASAIAGARGDSLRNTAEYKELENKVFKKERRFGKIKKFFKGIKQSGVDAKHWMQMATHRTLRYKKIVDLTAAALDRTGIRGINAYSLDPGELYGTILTLPDKTDEEINIKASITNTKWFKKLREEVETGHRSGIIRDFIRDRKRNIRKALYRATKHNKYKSLLDFLKVNGYPDIEAEKDPANIMMAVESIKESNRKTYNLIKTSRAYMELEKKVEVGKHGIFSPLRRATAKKFKKRQKNRKKYAMFYSLVQRYGVDEPEKLSLHELWSEVLGVFKKFDDKGEDNISRAYKKSRLWKELCREAGDVGTKLRTYNIARNIREFFTGNTDYQLNDRQMRAARKRKEFMEKYKDSSIILGLKGGIDKARTEFNIERLRADNAYMSDDGRLTSFGKIKKGISDGFNEAKNNLIRTNEKLRKKYSGIGENAALDNLKKKLGLDENVPNEDFLELLASKGLKQSSVLRRIRKQGFDTSKYRFDKNVFDKNPWLRNLLDSFEEKVNDVSNNVHQVSDKFRKNFEKYRNKMASKVRKKRYATGGVIEGYGHEGDTVNIKATPGEMILTKQDISKIKDMYGLDENVKSEDLYRIISAGSEEEKQYIINEIKHKYGNASGYQKYATGGVVKSENRSLSRTTDNDQNSSEDYSIPINPYKQPELFKKRFPNATEKVKLREYYRWIKYVEKYGEDAVRKGRIPELINARREALKSELEARKQERNKRREERREAIKNSKVTKFVRNNGTEFAALGAVAGTSALYNAASNALKNNENSQSKNDNGSVNALLKLIDNGSSNLLNRKEISVEIKDAAGKGVIGKIQGFVSSLKGKISEAINTNLTKAQKAAIKILPIARIGVIVADAARKFFIGWNDAPYYFGVNETDCDKKMHLTSALASAIKACVSTILVASGLGAVVGVIIRTALKDKDLVNGIYKVIATDVDKQELKNAQERLKERANKLGVDADKLARSENVRIRDQISLRLGATKDRLKGKKYNEAFTERKDRKISKNLGIDYDQYIKVKPVSNRENREKAIQDNIKQLKMRKHGTTDYEVLLRAMEPAGGDNVWDYDKESLYAAIQSLPSDNYALSTIKASILNTKEYKKLKSKVNNTAWDVLKRTLFDTKGGLAEEWYRLRKKLVKNLPIIGIKKYKSITSTLNILFSNMANNNPMQDIRDKYQLKALVDSLSMSNNPAYKQAYNNIVQTKAYAKLDADTRQKKIKGILDWRALHRYRVRRRRMHRYGEIIDVMRITNPNVDFFNMSNKELVAYIEAYSKTNPAIKQMRAYSVLQKDKERFIADEAKGEEKARRLAARELMKARKYRDLAKEAEESGNEKNAEKLKRKSQKYLNRRDSTYAKALEKYDVSSNNIDERSGKSFEAIYKKMDRNKIPENIRNAAIDLVLNGKYDEADKLIDNQIIIQAKNKKDTERWDKLLSNTNMGKQDITNAIIVALEHYREDYAHAFAIGPMYKMYLERMGINAHSISNSNGLPEPNTNNSERLGLPGNGIDVKTINSNPRDPLIDRIYGLGGPTENSERPVFATLGNGNVLHGNYRGGTHLRGNLNNSDIIDVEYTVRDDNSNEPEDTPTEVVARSDTTDREDIDSQDTRAIRRANREARKQERNKRREERNQLRTKKREERTAAKEAKRQERDRINRMKEEDPWHYKLYLLQQELDKINAKNAKKEEKQNEREVNAAVKRDKRRLYEREKFNERNEWIAFERQREGWLDEIKQNRDEHRAQMRRYKEYEPDKYEEYKAKKKRLKEYDPEAYKEMVYKEGKRSLKSKLISSRLICNPLVAKLSNLTHGKNQGLEKIVNTVQRNTTDPQLAVSSGIMAGISSLVTGIAGLRHFLGENDKGEGDEKNPETMFGKLHDISKKAGSGLLNGLSKAGDILKVLAPVAGVALGGASLVARGKKSAKIWKEQGAASGIGHMLGVDSYNEDDHKWFNLERGVSVTKAVKATAMGGVGKLAKAAGGSIVKIGKTVTDALGHFISSPKVAKIPGIGKVIKKLGSIVAKIGQKIENAAAKNAAKAAGRNGIKTIPGIGWAVAIGDAVFSAMSGANDAPSMFKVSPHDCTAGMRLTASLVKFLKSALVSVLSMTGVGTVLGVAIDIIIPDAWLIENLYKLVAGDAANEELKAKQKFTEDRAAQVGVSAQDLSRAENFSIFQKVGTGVTALFSKKSKDEIQAEKIAAKLGISVEEYMKINSVESKLNCKFKKIVAFMITNGKKSAYKWKPDQLLKEYGKMCKKQGINPEDIEGFSELQKDAKAYLDTLKSKGKKEAEKLWKEISEKGDTFVSKGQEILDSGKDMVTAAINSEAGQKVQGVAASAAEAGKEIIDKGRDEVTALAGDVSEKASESFDEIEELRQFYMGELKKSDLYKKYSNVFNAVISSNLPSDVKNKILGNLTKAESELDVMSILDGIKQFDPKSYFEMLENVDVKNTVTLMSKQISRAPGYVKNMLKEMRNEKTLSKAKEKAIKLKEDVEKYGGTGIFKKLGSKISNLAPVKGVKAIASGIGRFIFGSKASGVEDTGSTFGSNEGGVIKDRLLKFYPMTICKWLKLHPDSEKKTDAEIDKSGGPDCLLRHPELFVAKNGWSLPCPGSVADNGAYVITSPFGKRKQPVKGGDSFHHGVDFRTRAHVNLYAMNNGEVVRLVRHIGYYTDENGKTQYNKGGLFNYGAHVVIRFDSGEYAIYGHCSQINENLRVGSKVSSGEIIGKSGGDPYCDDPGTIGFASNGEKASTGAHLHLTMLNKDLETTFDAVGFICNGFRLGPDVAQVPIDNGKNIDVALIPILKNYEKNRQKPEATPAGSSGAVASGSSSQGGGVQGSSPNNAVSSSSGTVASASGSNSSSSTSSSSGGTKPGMGGPRIYVKNGQSADNPVSLSKNPMNTADQTTINEINEILDIQKRIYEEQTRHNSVSEKFFASMLALVSAMAKSSGQNKIHEQIDRISRSLTDGAMRNASGL